MPTSTAGVRKTADRAAVETALEALTGNEAAMTATQVKATANLRADMSAENSAGDKPWIPAEQGVVHGRRLPYGLRNRDLQPTINSASTKTANHDAAFSHQITAVDKDSVAITTSCTFAARNLPRGLSLDKRTGLITGVIADSEFHRRNLAAGATTSGSKTVTVTSTANARAGMSITGTGIPAKTFIHKVVNSTTLLLSKKATASNTGLTLVAGGRHYPTLFALKDGKSSAGQVLDITLKIAKPVISFDEDSPDEITIEEDAAMDPYQVLASHMDGDVHTYGATGLPAGLSIDADTGIISGTPTDSTAPEGVEVTLTATNDGGANVDTTTMTIIVTEPA